MSRPTVWLSRSIWSCACEGGYAWFYIKNIVEPPLWTLCHYHFGDYLDMSLTKMCGNGGSSECTDASCYSWYNRYHVGFFFDGGVNCAGRTLANICLYFFLCNADMLLRNCRTSLMVITMISLVMKVNIRLRRRCHIQELDFMMWLSE